MDLVILAAGMGSRFGGLKQLTPIDKQGNFIIDYSIYDAIACGFDRIVFIIKKENLDTFRKSIGHRVEEKIKTLYVFQKNDNIPTGFDIPKDRVKPFGTGHALLCCKDVLHDNFAVINADDFYGRGAIKLVAEFLKETADDKHFCMAGYRAENTLSENGSVKRGVCKGGKYLSSIVESSLRKDGDTIFARPLDEEEEKVITPNTIVSMSLFGFAPIFLDFLEKDFINFLNENADKLDSCEYLLPTQIEKYIKQEKASMEILNTSEKWYGMTYKEDKKGVEEAIESLKQKEIYPKSLWN